MLPEEVKGKYMSLFAVDREENEMKILHEIMPFEPADEEGDK
ncbi:hypothetical protein [Bacillus sonorensis]|nr:hypothetical protein [Bacillus sonorensis]